MTDYNGKWSISTNEENPPFHEPDVYLGADGQLWQWTPRGQVTLASGGFQALEWGRRHQLPQSQMRILASYVKGREKNSGPAYNWTSEPDEIKNPSMTREAGES